jgi:hypothetical protein
MKILSLAATLICTIATCLAAPAYADEAGLLLEMNISKAGSTAMTPKLWGKVGSKSSISVDGNLTVEVTSAAATAGNVTLEIAITEKMKEGHKTSKLSRTVPLDSQVTMQLGSDPVASWVVQFTPRITPSPRKPAA